MERQISEDDLDAVYRAALTAQLADAERRLALLSGLPTAQLSALPVVARPADQLLSDLRRLAAMPRIESRQMPPLDVWLRNAIRLVAHLPTVTAVFKGLLHSTTAVRPITVKVLHMSTRAFWTEERPSTETIRAVLRDAKHAIGQRDGGPPASARAWLVAMHDPAEHPIHPATTLGELAIGDGVALNLQWAARIHRGD